MIDLTAWMLGMLPQAGISTGNKLSLPAIKKTMDDWFSKIDEEPEYSEG